MKIMDKVPKKTDMTVFYNKLNKGMRIIKGGQKRCIKT
jgi:hypothetical protein